MRPGIRHFGFHHWVLPEKAKKVARQIFHGMIVHGPGLQNKQMFLFRIVDIAVEIYTQSAVKAYAKKVGHGEDLADVYCENSDRKIRTLFFELWHNSDKKKYKMAKAFVEKKYEWLEEGIVKATQSPAIIPKTESSQNNISLH